VDKAIEAARGVTSSAHGLGSALEETLIRDYHVNGTIWSWG
jgi:hypothetical protein